MIEEEILIGRRAFPEAQALFATTTLRTLAETQTVGWHGSTLSAEEPAFALVQRGGALDNDVVGDDDGLIGEVLVLTRAGADETIYVYCLGAANIPTALSVPLRAFAALAVPTAEQIECVVGVGT